MEQRSLFHSFLRPVGGSIDEDSSLAVLDLICGTGLLAVPEVYKYSVPIKGGEFTEVALIQCRSALTCLFPSEVPQHAKFFGPITIEIPLETGLAAGAFPVWYVPRESEELEDFSRFGGHVLGTMVAMLGFLKHLADLDYYYEQTISGKQHRTTAREMFDMLNRVQANLYPIDTKRHDVPELAYYAQNEWRILPGLEVGKNKNSRPLSNDEKEAVRQTNPSFWSKTVAIKEERVNRLDDSRVIQLYGGENIVRYVPRIHVHSDLSDRVREVVSRHRLNVEIVPFEPDQD